MLEAEFTKKLWHFDLEIAFKAEGNILVLWGPSGSGKTTVLHCLAGLKSPSGGVVKLNERILYSHEERVNVPTRARNAGYLFQDYALFPHLTVKQNVLYGLKCNKLKCPSTDIKEMLNTFGIGHLNNRFPSQLSGGEKQRVALARALAVRPNYLLLDEPFSALDKSIKKILRSELKKVHRKWQIPFILVTHDEEDASYLGDIIISIDKGRSREIITNNAQAE
ncbi:ATP-binding cassette domain-containing protein [Desulfotruncus alcoholivorax]|uniref:ATP-binding cassette domain-containing protein n=1 Tax=Desulfotruncus alcoholivorax TaxID=265477 RepID=UPI000419DB99|nr:ATP-binding cassette domain-containing protein [Desulfotruncus alcoholivorax]